MTVYIENEGAIYRGFARAWPQEIWNGTEFVPYKGKTPKGIEWGNIIDEAEAHRLIDAYKKIDAREKGK